MSVTDFLLSKAEFTLMKSGSIRCQGKLITRDNLDSVLRSQLPGDVYFELVGLCGGYEKYRASQGQIYDGVEAILSKPPDIDLPSVDFNGTPLSSIFVIVNMQNHHRSVLYNEETDSTDTVSYDFILRMVTKACGKEVASAWETSNAVMTHTTYDPSSPKRFLEDRRFNTYAPPSWRRNWEPEISREFPELFSSLLKALFPEKKEQALVCAWLRDCTFDRAEPILILSGSPGVGKNTLIEYVGRALVGIEHYSSAQRNFQESRFHSNLANTRLFFADEYQLDARLRDQLKSFHNGFVTIERKGLDVGKPEKIFASFVLANNHPEQIKLEYSDRKFFVPKLTTIGLEETLGKEKIEDLVKACNNEKFIRDVASALHTKYKKGQCLKFGKSDTFKALCMNSYPRYFRRLVEACSDHVEIQGRKFNRVYGVGRQIDADVLKDHVTHYERQFREKLCTIVGHGQNWTCYPEGVEVRSPETELSVEDLAH